MKECMPESNDWEKEFDKLFVDKFGMQEVGSETIKKFIRSEMKKSYELGWYESIKQAHNTADGYCCACDYDIAVMKDKISQAKEEMKKDIQKLIAEEMLICHQTGEKTSRLTSLANKIK